MDLELFRKWKASGDIKLRDRLVKENLRLVYTVAHKMSKGNDCDFEELAQAGAIGLMTALNRFDPERKTQFSTYAVYWIRYEMQLAGTKNQRVHKPRKTAGPNPPVLPLGDLLEHQEVHPHTYPEALCDPDDPEENVERSLDRQKVRAAVDVLPEPHRTIMTRRLAGETWTQIGEGSRALESEALEMLREGLRVASE